MCGLIGVVTSLGRNVGVTPQVLGAACDMLAHRGPDGAGVWRESHVALAHRRLAILDTSPAGAQPMVVRTREGAPRLVIAYNGELYNDQDLRRDLHPTLDPRAERFHSACDTETLAHALLARGLDAAPRLRGMYAFAAYDPAREVLTLARDPLGIKPLYWTRWTAQSYAEVAFASELSALVSLRAAATGAAPAPDLVSASAYCTTIRTTLGARTLFQGVQVVEPGQWVEINLREPDLPTRTTVPPMSGSADIGASSPSALVRATIEDSVYRHLRSDVPVCALLSGGLDSSITTCLARREKPDLLTFAAGARPDSTHTGPDDLSAARECAAFFGTRHHEAIVDESLFHERWAWMVDRLGLPLSTPNEVAINHVARTLRSAGCVVTLSGEGADELFAGYDQALDGAAAYADTGGDDPGVHELDHLGWAPLSAKPALLREDAWRRLERDEALVTHYRERYALVRSEADDPLQANLLWQQRVNLVGLLQRLDTATMLEGVEGRTPFADCEVLRVANALPLALKFTRNRDATPGAVRTKLALREAFRGVLPPVALTRPKASFPLPFAAWMGSTSSPVPDLIRASPLLRSLFRDECLALVASAPSASWRLAWPLANLALWERRWWG